MKDVQTRIEASKMEIQREKDLYHKNSISITRPSYTLSRADFDTVKIAMSEIKEIHKHVIYTLQRVEQRISEVESIIKNMKFSGER